MRGWVGTSVTRLGELLNLGQLFNAFGNNYFARNRLHFTAIFLKVFHFSSKTIFGQLFINIWRLLSGHTGGNPGLVVKEETRVQKVVFV